jgi:Ca2+-binding EF-hand superfamily protein
MLLRLLLAVVCIILCANADSGPESKAKDWTPEEKAEMQKELKRIFKILDRNKDKKLSLKEIKKHLNKGIMNRMASDDKRILEEAKTKAPKQLRNKDYDKDGFVTREEMFKVPEYDEKFQKHQEHVFDLADRNHDGKLDVSELMIFMHPEISEHKQEYNEMVAQEHISEVDSDSDGHITWAEHWHNVIHGHDFSPEQIQDLNETETELFFRHDKDEDGQLTRKELHELLFPDLENIDFVGPQAGHVHEIADTNNDGLVSWKEATENAELLVSNLAVGEHSEL